jgi:deoxyribodipyrimidine photo-lyase
MEKVNFFWFRRDLRLEDNHGLYEALKSGKPVIPLFIFDREILDKLEEKEDKRVQFLHDEINKIKKDLRSFGSDIIVRYGKPLDVWKDLFNEYEIEGIYLNRDYEPYARERDAEIASLAKESGAGFFDFKDQVIFDCDEILKDDGDPYVVYTPFSRKWLDHYENNMSDPFPSSEYFDAFKEYEAESMPSLESMGFKEVDFEVPDRKVEASLLNEYADKRDLPAEKATSRLSVHLRFGTVSIRHLTKKARIHHSDSWLNELIWRNFYQVIIWHFPDRIENAFKKKYDNIKWRNNEKEFKAWCEGKTGYPIVDAGMRQLNETGFMHNRVRMITASFLTKHLLIDWRWGEAYFAKKLLDFELASNNGGWQWAAGSGCDAAPYFRVFNPYLQTKKFDPEKKYIKEWVPEFGTDDYPEPIVEHKAARKRALDTYKTALDN